MKKAPKQTTENGKKQPYDVSVVMSVYNVKLFLEEAVECLVHQTIGFENIQLILVDDGSTDGSGAICDQYGRRYPEQCMVIHKKNGGLSSARNAGLPFVKGRYVSFFDPDDVLERDALERICSFMDAHKEVDVCCIPIFLFGYQSGPHALNYKFDKGSRVIDLSEDENADNILLSGASSFYRSTAAKKMDYDTRISAEDAKQNLTLFMDNPKIGVISDTKYHYRKHGNSVLDRLRFEKKGYLPHLQFFSKWALDMAEDRFGFIPKYVQHTVMYDLQWKLEAPIARGVLTPEEEDDYKQLLFQIIGRIDDDVILKQRYLGMPQKLFALREKHGHSPTISFDDNEACINGYSTGDVVLTFGHTMAERASQMPSFLEFASFEKTKNRITLEGSHLLYGGIERLDVKPYLIVNSRVFPCEKVNRSDHNVVCLGTEITRRTGFKVELPIEETPIEIRLALLIGHTLVIRTNTVSGQFFPVSEVYENMRAYKAGYMLCFNKGALVIATRPLWIGRTIREFSLLAEIWHKNLLGGRKAAVGRVVYHLVMPFKRKKLWIVSDRIVRADDNGEALFRYLMKNRPKNTRIFFSISKESVDADRLAQIGPCIDAMSFRHKLLHLLCDVNISSQADEVTINPFSRHDDALRDLLTHQSFVFLQHGITKDDISGWLNRYNANISGFVTAAIPEYRSILKSRCAYPEDRIWLAGFPRFDRLYHDEHNYITLMPTWRMYLMDPPEEKSGVWKEAREFEKSSYYKFYSLLMCSDHLISTLEKLGYVLCFFPHPNMQLCNVQFKHDPRVLFFPKETAYRDIFAQSKLVITDYSSAVFDFAYLRKPVIYCQFDKEEFFAGGHVYTQGYYDYERDGFGEVEYDLESAIDRIIEYVVNGCQLKPQYRTRIDQFFAFDDHDNCKRVLEQILCLSDREY